MFVGNVNKEILHRCVSKQVQGWPWQKHLLQRFTPGNKYHKYKPVTANLQSVYKRQYTISVIEASYVNEFPTVVTWL